jgi:hypothetical protein
MKIKGDGIITMDRLSVSMRASRMLTSEIDSETMGNSGD